MKADSRSGRLGGFIAAPGLFRILLAYLVVVNHFVPFHLGATAVFLFFMLSGYWVSRMWNAEYAATSNPYRNFLLSRFWRLMPVYYIALSLLILINVFFGTTANIVTAAAGSSRVHFLFSQLFIVGYANLPIPAKLIQPVWSLDIELQFYFVAPLLIALLAKYPLLSWPRLLLYAAAIAGLALYVRFFGHDPESAYLPMYLLFFLIGLHSARHDWRPRKRTALAGLGIAGLLVVACMSFPAARPLLVYSKTQGVMAGYSLDFNIILALLVAAYAMATVNQQPAKGTWLARIDRDLSSLSYEVYLLHVMALSLVIRLFGHLSKYDRLGLAVVAWVLLLPASWLVYRYFDKPIERLRRAWVKSRKRPVVAIESVFERSQVRQLS